MTFSNQKSPTKPAVEDGEAIIEEEDGREDLDEADIKNPHRGIRRISADCSRESDPACDNDEAHDNDNGPGLRLRRYESDDSANTDDDDDNQNTHPLGDARIEEDKPPSLLSIAQVPAHLRFNKYVWSHYRPPLDAAGCVASLCYWHNESLNILTHALPVLFIFCSIPWLLPWSAISVPLLPWTHVAACLAPWIGSTLYHLFMCHQSGKGAYLALLKVDLLGIWFTQTLGALVIICAAIHCFSPETKGLLLLLYLGVCLLCLYQAMTVSTVWGRRFAFTAPFLIRVLCLCVRLSPWGGGAPLTTRHIILQDMLAITGGYIGAVNIPEKWFPGKCDTLCNSHHIMHVLVVAAVYHMHKAAEMDLVWMSRDDMCQEIVW